VAVVQRRTLAALCFAVTATLTVFTSGAAAQVMAREAAIEKFYAQWDSTWRVSERDRSPRPDPGANAAFAQQFPGGRHRRPAAFCTPMRVPTPTVREFRGSQILSQRNWFALCPGWHQGGLAYDAGGDERLWIDAAISPARRPAIIAARDSLLTILEAAWRAAPADSVLVGDVVRFAVDQRAWPRAFAAVEQCQASRSWCEALRGYALVRNAREREAGEAFRRAFDSANDAQRCRWEDYSLLFEPPERAAYSALDCAARRQQTTWLWALSAPLWSDGQNPRWVEHMRRHVEIALRQSFHRDERWTWVDSLGADARIEMVLRYGWPSFVYWPGDLIDRDKIGLMREYRGIGVAPNTTNEYSAGRQHLIPSWSAVQNPFAIQSADWSISAPPGWDSPSPLDSLWWPVEHFLSPVAVVSMVSGQTALLRRQSHVHLATATALDPARLKRRASETIDTVRLFAAHTPDSIMSRSHARGIVGSEVILRSDIDARPAVLSIEFTGPGPARPAGRARFGIKPPPALNTLASTDRAVSDPVLLRIPGGNAPLVATPDSALPWMLGTTTIPPVGQVGVYWETYGFAPDDTIQHAVWIQRVTPQGTLRRLGISLNVATDRNTPVAVSWTETRLGGNAEDLGGPVRIIGRKLTVDVSSLSPGEYILEVAATSGGREAVRGQRTFTVAK